MAVERQASTGLSLDNKQWGYSNSTEVTFITSFQFNFYFAYTEASEYTWLGNISYYVRQI